MHFNAFHLFPSRVWESFSVSAAQSCLTWRLSGHTGGSSAFYRVTFVKKSLPSEPMVNWHWGIKVSLLFRGFQNWLTSKSSIACRHLKLWRVWQCSSSEPLVSIGTAWKLLERRADLAIHLAWLIKWDKSSTFKKDFMTLRYSLWKVDMDEAAISRQVRYVSRTSGEKTVTWFMCPNRIEPRNTADEEISCISGFNAFWTPWTLTACAKHSLYIFTARFTHSIANLT